MLYDIPTNLYAPHWQCQLPSRCNESRLFYETKPLLSRIGHSSFLCLGIMQIPMHFLSIAFRLDCSFGRQHHLALYARIFVIFFQISDKHRIQPQFLADFLRIWVSQEEERKYICPDLPWRKSASGAFFVPGLFFFKDDEKSSNVSRAHSTHSTCLTNGLWADLRACKPNISMDQSCEISKY